MTHLWWPMYQQQVREAFFPSQRFVEIDYNQHCWCAFSAQMWWWLPSPINSWYLLPLPYKRIDSPVENRWISNYSIWLIEIIYSNFFLHFLMGGNWIQPSQTSLMGDSAQLSSFDFPIVQEKRERKVPTIPSTMAEDLGMDAKNGRFFCLKGHILSIHFVNFTDLSWFVINQLQVDVLMYSNSFLKISSNEKIIEHKSHESYRNLPTSYEFDQFLGFIISSLPVRLQIQPWSTAWRIIPISK